MPVDVLTNPDQIRLTGPVAMINDPGNPGAPQAVATGTAVISIPTGGSAIKLTAAAATTGASLPLGSFDGQILWITITTAALNTVTFAAAGTSNVAGGTSVSLAGLATHLFRWDAPSALWYQVGPATN